MRRGSQYRTLLQALSGAARLFAMPIASAGASIILGDRKAATRTASSFQGDPTALEAFVNHVHLDDLLGGLPLSTDGAREALVALGRALVEVYTERARPFLGGRELIFYLGGRDTVSLRFHVFRGSEEAWARLDDADFLEQERCEVIRIK